MATHPPVAPPAPPVTEHTERSTRSWWSRVTATGQGFPTIIAGLIAVTSILAAVAAWRAADVSENANRDDLTAIQQYSEREQELSVLRSHISEDERSLALYQQHLRSSQVLRTSADAVRTSQPGVARQLDLEAQAELVLSKQQIFWAPDALSGAETADTPIQYERASAFSTLTARDRKLQQFAPEAILARADRLHGRSLGFLLLAILFVFALVFLTVAQFGRRATRLIFVSAGSLITLGAGIVLIAFWMTSA